MFLTGSLLSEQEPGEPNFRCHLPGSSASRPTSLSTTRIAAHKPAATLASTLMSTSNQTGVGSRTQTRLPAPAPAPASSSSTALVRSRALVPLAGRDNGTHVRDPTAAAPTRDEAFITGFFQDIDLSGQGLVVLDAGLARFLKLRELSVCRNRLTSIDYLPPNLLVLNAYNNNISMINAGIATPNSHCKSLNANACELGSQPHSGGTGKPSWLVLDPSAAAAAAASSSTISRTPPLLQLGLGYNELSSLTSLLPFTNSLVFLDLSYNNLSDLGHVVAILSRFKRLKYLYLQGNPICLSRYYRIVLESRLSFLSTLDDVPLMPFLPLNTRAIPFPTPGFALTPAVAQLAASPATLQSLSRPSSAIPLHATSSMPASSSLTMSSSLGVGAMGGSLHAGQGVQASSDTLPHSTLPSASLARGQVTGASSSQASSSLNSSGSASSSSSSSASSLPPSGSAAASGRGKPPLKPKATRGKPGAGPAAGAGAGDADAEDRTDRQEQLAARARLEALATEIDFALSPAAASAPSTLSLSLCSLTGLLSVATIPSVQASDAAYSARVHVLAQSAAARGSIAFASARPDKRMKALPGPTYSSTTSESHQDGFSPVHDSLSNPTSLLGLRAPALSLSLPFESNQPEDAGSTASSSLAGGKPVPEYSEPSSAFPYHVRTSLWRTELEPAPSFHGPFNVNVNAHVSVNEDVSNRHINTQNNNNNNNNMNNDSRSLSDWNPTQTIALSQVAIPAASSVVSHASSLTVPTSSSSISTSASSSSSSASSFLSSSSATSTAADSSSMHHSSSLSSNEPSIYIAEVVRDRASGTLTHGRAIEPKSWLVTSGRPMQLPEHLLQEVYRLYSRPTSARSNVFLGAGSKPSTPAAPPSSSISASAGQFISGSGSGYASFSRSPSPSPTPSRLGPSTLPNSAIQSPPAAPTASSAASVFTSLPMSRGTVTNPVLPLAYPPSLLESRRLVLDISARAAMESIQDAIRTGDVATPTAQPIPSLATCIGSGLGEPITFTADGEATSHGGPVVRYKAHTEIEYVYFVRVILPSGEIIESTPTVWGLAIPLDMRHDTTFAPTIAWRDTACLVGLDALVICRRICNASISLSKTVSSAAMTGGEGSGDGVTSGSYYSSTGTGGSIPPPSPSPSLSSLSSSSSTRHRGAGGGGGGGGGGDGDGGAAGSDAPSMHQTMTSSNVMSGALATSSTSSSVSSKAAKKKKGVEENVDSIESTELWRELYYEDVITAVGRIDLSFAMAGPHTLPASLPEQAKLQYPTQMQMQMQQPQPQAVPGVGVSTAGRPRSGGLVNPLQETAFGGVDGPKPPTGAMTNSLSGPILSNNSTSTVTNFGWGHHFPLGLLEPLTYRLNHTFTSMRVGLVEGLAPSYTTYAWNPNTQRRIVDSGGVIVTAEDLASRPSRYVVVAGPSGDVLQPGSAAYAAAGSLTVRIWMNCADGSAIPIEANPQP